MTHTRDLQTNGNDEAQLLLMPATIPVDRKSQNKKNTTDADCRVDKPVPTNSTICNKFLQKHLSLTVTRTHAALPP